MSFLKKIVRWLVPGVETSADGREKWPSRTAYILASMGGAVGVGNLLRYPSIAFDNSGLQWFIAYFVALFFIGIPILAMEICFGQAYRGGTVVSFGRISRRIRGLGLSTVFIGYLAATYYVVIMSWVMTYFRNSFISPLPWAANNQKFFKDHVLRNPDPIKDPNGGFTKFPATGVIGETLGWTAMTWVLVYLCVFKGVSLTGRVVYFTMLFPLALILILTIRSVTLENSWRGIKLYIGEFHAHKLFGGKMWTEAIIQIFFSIGVGFGYYAAYSSYNSQYANAVQDSVIIACSNSLIEMFAGFAAFGVLGYISNNPAATKVSTFTLGFLTYPAALARLPGSNAWSVVFFLTLYLLGIDSAFAYLEGFITVVMDTDWGKKPPRTLIVGAITLGAALLSILYTTEFGRHLFNAIDTWITAVTLMLCMWLQCSIVTSVYRYKDVLSQTGKAPYIVAQVSYFASMIVGAILLQTVGGAAAGASFGGILVAGTLLAVFICKTEPTVEAPKPFNTSKFGNKFWWLTSYSGHQLSRDLNVIIAQGKNWGLPFLWAPILRWFSAPILMIILSFAYPRFATKGETESDHFGYVRSPLHIFGFVLAHVGVLIALIGIIIPNSMNVWVSDSEKYAYRKQYESEPGKVLEEVQDIEGDPNGLERKDSKSVQDSSDENDS